MLYAITDSHLLPGDKLFSGVEAALDSGCKWIQYRDKSQDTTRRLQDAQALLALCDQYAAKLIINDDVALAKKIGAHGVHLGQGDGSVIAARRILHRDAIIGVTCHDSIELAKKAAQEGADYVAFGRFFPSNTKPDARPAPLSLIGEARAELGSIPIAVIGGITLENAHLVISAGADLIAVCENLFSAENIAVQTTLFLQL